MPVIMLYETVSAVLYCDLCRNSEVELMPYAFEKMKGRTSRTMMENDTPKLCSRDQLRLSSCLYPSSARRSSSRTLVEGGFKLSSMVDLLGTHSNRVPTHAILAGGLAHSSLAGQGLEMAYCLYISKVHIGEKEGLASLGLVNIDYCQVLRKDIP